VYQPLLFTVLIARFPLSGLLCINLYRLSQNGFDLLCQGQRRDDFHIAPERQYLADQLFVGDHVDAQGGGCFVVGDDLLAGMKGFGFDIRGAPGGKTEEDALFLPALVVSDADDVVEILRGINDTVGYICRR